jgi:hypothetical protein
MSIPAAVTPGAAVQARGRDYTRGGVTVKAQDSLVVPPHRDGGGHRMARAGLRSHHRRLEA